jgi:flagellar basal body rod protein FlgG
MPNLTTSISSSISAMDAMGTVMQATANNIANVNSHDYKALRVDLESGPQDQGVRVGAIFRDPSPGPAVVTHLSEREYRTIGDQTAQGMQAAANAYEASRTYEHSLTDAADARASVDAQNIIRSTPSPFAAAPYAEGSNTNLPLEFANLSVTETAYSANAAVIRTLDVMTGSLLNAIA